MKKNKKLVLLLALTIFTSLFFGCKSDTNGQSFAPKEKLGFEGRVFYEIFVRSFNDSNGDGIGDLKGITQKLDYLAGLGVKGLWLMPINESPSYHGYDVSDYYNVEKDYGSIEDLKELISEAHKRDILVTMDLVLNHSSSQHPWFTEAATDKNSKYRNFYIWADEKTNVNEGSPISAQPWTPYGDSHYYAIFWSGMPDLNYDNKEVREEMKKVAKFWLDMGIDGFRLDAVKWVYTDNLDKNIEWWKEFTSFVKSVNKNVVTIGEVWDSNPDVIAPYMAALDSCFNFPVRDALAGGTSSDSFATGLATLLYSRDIYAKYNKDFVDTPFLNNHDINRVISEVQDVEKYKKAAAVLLTLPGTPFMYYGEETGLEGMKPDEMIREPFIWDTDTSKNTSWMSSSSDPNKVAVTVQEKDKKSLLNLYKDIIKVRNENTALLTGDFELLESESTVTAMKRSDVSETVFVFVNQGAEKAKQKITIEKGEVIYSSVRELGNIKFKNSEFEIEGNEILIIRKAADK